MANLTLITHVSIVNLNNYIIGVNLALNIADVGFDNFCLMYTAQGIVNTLTMSSLSGKKGSKGGIMKESISTSLSTSSLFI